LPGAKCPEYEKCFYFKARRKIYGADILVVNHALFFSDLACAKKLWASADYQVGILDEAHTIEDVRRITSVADHARAGRLSIEPVVSTTNRQGLLAYKAARKHFVKSRGSPSGGSVLWPNPIVAFDTDPKTQGRSRGFASDTVRVRQPRSSPTAIRGAEESWPRT